MDKEDLYKVLDLYHLGRIKSYDKIVADNKFCRVMKERLRCLCLEHDVSMRFLGDSFGLAYNICGMLYLPLLREYLHRDVFTLYQNVERYCFERFKLSDDDTIILRSIVFLIFEKYTTPLGDEETIDCLLSHIAGQNRLFAKGVYDFSIEDNKKYRFDFEKAPDDLDKGVLHGMFSYTDEIDNKDIDKIYKYVVCSYPLDRRWKVVHEIESYFESSLYWDIYEKVYYADELRKEVKKGMEYLKSLVVENTDGGDKREGTKSRSGGRTPEPLFKNAEGKKDVVSTEKYAILFVEYLKKHHSSNKELRSEKENYVSRAFVVFYWKWAEEGIVPSSPNGSACCRFLKEDCKLELRVKDKPYGDFIRGMIKDTEPNYLLDIEEKVNDFLCEKKK